MPGRLPGRLFLVDADVFLSRLDCGADAFCDRAGCGRADLSGRGFFSGSRMGSGCGEGFLRAIGLGCALIGSGISSGRGFDGAGSVTGGGGSDWSISSTAGPGGSGCWEWASEIPARDTTIGLCPGGFTGRLIGTDHINRIWTIKDVPTAMIHLALSEMRSVASVSLGFNACEKAPKGIFGCGCVIVHRYGPCIFYKKLFFKKL